MKRGENFSLNSEYPGICHSYRQYFTRQLQSWECRGQSPQMLCESCDIKKSPLARWIKFCHFISLLSSTRGLFYICNTSNYKTEKIQSLVTPVSHVHILLLLTAIVPPYGTDLHTYTTKHTSGTWLPFLSSSISNSFQKFLRSRYVFPLQVFLKGVGKLSCMREKHHNCLTKEKNRANHTAILKAPPCQ